MRVATKIKTSSAKIVLSPWFLDYYTPLGYVVVDAVGRWVEVCVTDSCGTYTPEFRWQFDVTCGEATKIYAFLKRLLDGPPWPVFKIIREAFIELERALRKHCRQI